jgi:hypothetical protein
MFICENCNQAFRKEALYNSHLAKNSCKKNKVHVDENDQNIMKFYKNGEINQHNLDKNIKEISINEKFTKKKIIIPNKDDDEESISSNITEDNAKIKAKKNVGRKRTINYDFEGMETRLIRLEEKMDMILNFMEELKDKRVNINGDDNSHQFICVKKEKLKMEDENVLESLKQKSIESDAEVLYGYYLRDIEHKNYSIKKLKSNEYTFLGECGWQIDKNGVELKVILSHNLKKLYTRINRYEIIQNNDDVLKNQEYINSISDKKYQTNLLEMFSDKYLE